MLSADESPESRLHKFFFPHFEVVTLNNAKMAVKFFEDLKEGDLAHLEHLVIIAPECAVDRHFHFNNGNRSQQISNFHVQCHGPYAFTTSSFQNAPYSRLYKASCHKFGGQGR